MVKDTILKLKSLKIANEQNLKHHILDMSLLSQLTPNALTQHDLEIEEMMMVYLIHLFLHVIYCFIICRSLSLPT